MNVRQSRSFVVSFFMTAALAVGMCAVGHAQDGDDNSRHERWTDDDGPRAVPEIDPASASAALAMLAGGVFVIRGRKQQQR